MGPGIGWELAALLAVVAAAYGLAGVAVAIADRAAGRRG